MALIFDDELPPLPRGCSLRNVEAERDMTVVSFDGKRKVEYKEGAYEEYANLWARYMRLYFQTLKRNQYVYDEDGTTKIILRIQELIRAERDNPDKIKELRTYEQHHINVWEEMENVIDLLAKCDYVKRRTQGKTRDYKSSLYDDIMSEGSRPILP